MKKLPYLLLLTLVSMLPRCSDDPAAICRCSSGYVCDEATGKCILAGDLSVGQEAGLPELGTDQQTAGDGQQVKYFDGSCPPQGVATIRQETTVTAVTSAQPLESHCMLDNPYSAVGQLEVLEETTLRFQAGAPANEEMVLSLRSACEVDHGCQLGSGSVDYSRTVPAGSYNIVVATGSPAQVTLTVQFLAPAE